MFYFYEDDEIPFAQLTITDNWTEEHIGINNDHLYNDNEFSVIKSIRINQSSDTRCQFLGDLFRVAQVSQTSSVLRNTINHYGLEIKLKRVTARADSKPWAG